MEEEDWEVLETPSLPSNLKPTATEHSLFDYIDGAICPDYFALDAKYPPPQPEVVDEADSDNPSWIDPNSDFNRGGSDKGVLGFWSDSSGHNDVVIGSTVSEVSGEVYSDSGRDDAEEDVKTDVGSEAEEPGAVAEAGGEGKKRGVVVWWKVPFEMMKLFAFRVKPVWSFSVAVAIIGLVVMGRRLYDMKRKSRSVALKVTVDDKKVSQFMVRAARLNDAFSVVRRVPIVRAQLPPAVTPWPVMSMR
ncbi:hypothetical protein QJS10_CPA08g00882 [Acorus calamus]|uniref:DUF6821 domain-containing protein n=1 Tax=Acorus calamus TaxID=4465 RepID=A0AAV9EBL7_ACOCL|nr:hypothetical protein QJS10_CPA08g00882 [Acorus calamus]